MKVVFLVVAPCSVVKFTVTSIMRAMITALMIEAENTSETPVNVYQITRLNIPADSNLKNKKYLKYQTLFTKEIFNCISNTMYFPLVCNNYD